MKRKKKNNLSFCCLVVLSLSGGGQEIGELLVGSGEELGLSPELWGEEGVGAGKSVEGSLDEVSEGLGASGGGGEAIVDSGVGKNLLGHTTSDSSSSTGSRNQTETDRSALSSHLHGDGVGKTDLVTPVSTADGDDVQLGVDDGSTDGGGDFLGALDSESDVSVVISDDDEGLEAGALSGTSLLLHGGDLHHLILELGAKEVVKDLVFLDGESEQVDVLKRLDLSALHETSELGHGHPITLLVVLSSTARATAATSTSALSLGATVSTTTASSTSESSSESSTTTTITTICHCF